MVFAAIAAVYIAVALTLVFWPSPEPFADAGANEPHRQLGEVGSAVDAAAGPEATTLAIEARDRESILVRRYGAGASTTIILMHGIASDASDSDRFLLDRFRDIQRNGFGALLS